MQLKDRPLCAVDDCPRPAKTRGWCQKHYMRWWVHGDPLIVLPRGHFRTQTSCNVAGCSEVPLARGWCHLHYKRWKATGDPLKTLPMGRPQQTTCENGHDDWYVYTGARASQRYCRTCHNQNEARTPTGRRRELLKRKHGMTLEKFEDLLASQGGVCAICGEVPHRTHLDHSHTTGRIRGILCYRCNIGIGYLQESPRILQAAIAYLSTFD